ncbi:MAG: histidine--tRNA ligase, partial [Rhizorhabdus sp.]|uniref:His/Gly/Thr/Pro-type tRNA ligase C-terminal domain-containing protein n=1 Tax=Rhizorhabdus sp. TaxID=1968843 RepID=UPI001B7B6DE7
RRAGLAADMAYKGKMKRRMQKADAAGARYAVIIGDDEVARGEVSLKDMGAQSQRPVAVDALVAALKG